MQDCNLILTPPFMESSVRTIYRELTEAVKTYNNLLPADGQAVLSTGNKDALNRASLAVKKLTVNWASIVNWNWIVFLLFLMPRKIFSV